MGRHQDQGTQTVLSPFGDPPTRPAPRRFAKELEKPPREDSSKNIDWSTEPVQHVYSHMRSLAIQGLTKECRYIAELLVRERKEQPSVEIYNALILSNIGYEHGTAWRAAELLEDMEKDGLQPGMETCHAVLKVLSVHPDHLLRTDVLHYMSTRWIQLSEDGAHDVAVGLFREGLFEQALNRMDKMRQDHVHLQSWLLDAAVYVLCEANEISEAYRIMRERVELREQISRSLWIFFVDKASEARHHAATALAWSNQISQRFINPSSGMCLNILATASEAGDATMATEIFTHLSKRLTAFQPIHYELLIKTYLATSPPDLPRALSVLPIMALERVYPTPMETRSLFEYMRDKPDTLPQAIETLRELCEQGQKMPIAALNVIIECYVEQGNLAEAIYLYKQIHTFAPPSHGASRSFANVETFNLLLKGCRNAEPPDAAQGSFLVSELLALQVKPTALTYDRLILLFVKAGQHYIAKDFSLSQSSEANAERTRKTGLDFLDWSYRHFTEMHPLGWIPRVGTLEQLATALAQTGDARCWDVLQAGEDGSEGRDWQVKAVHIRRNVEAAWEKARQAQATLGVGNQDQADDERGSTVRASAVGG